MYRTSEQYGMVPAVLGAGAVLVPVWYGTAGKLSESW
jgi:hypothetical protein